MKRNNRFQCISRKEMQLQQAESERAVLGTAVLLLQTQEGGRPPAENRSHRPCTSLDRFSRRRQRTSNDRQRSFLFPCSPLSLLSENRRSSGL